MNRLDTSRLITKFLQTSRACKLMLLPGVSLACRRLQSRGTARHFVVNEKVTVSKRKAADEGHSGAGFGCMEETGRRPDDAE